MQISVSDAKALLTDLVRRAEAGDDVVLTRHGRPMVRLVPIRTVPTPAHRRGVLEAVGARVAAKRDANAQQDTVPAARSQDFLYGDDGLPV